MKTTLLAFLALVLAGSIARAEPVFPRGSRVGLTPPPGMVVSERFTGFEDPKRETSIRLSEWPDADHARLVSSLDALAAGGLKVLSREEFGPNGLRGLLMTADQESTQGAGRLRKWLLVVSDSSLSAMVVAQTTENRHGYGDAEMRAVLRTISLRPPTGAEEDLAALPYRIGERAGLRLMRVRNDGAAFTDGSADVFEPLAQPTLTISLAHSLKGLALQPPAQRDRFVRQLALGDPDLTNAVLDKLDLVQNGRGERYDTIVKAKDRKSGQGLVRVLSLLMVDGRIVSMVGTTRAEWRERDVPRFQAVIRSVALKP